MVNVAVLGATGFTGEKLVELLAGHRGVRITYLSSRTPKPVAYGKMFPRFAKVISVPCETMDVAHAASRADFFFLALPHTVSMKVAPKLLGKKKRVVDLSADYRLKSPQAYKTYYKAVHSDKKNLKTAVYGMPELYRKDISAANLVANPGCYPTAVILGLAPLCKNRLIETDGIFIDAKSSITGAGRKAHIDYHYAHIDGNIWAYKAFVHQHVPEMTQVLKSISLKDVSLRFIPHVVGVHSGIYATIFTRLTKKATAEKIGTMYRKFYARAPFVRIRDDFPKLSDVVGTNFCDIGIACDEKNRHCVITAAIDNLVKGAAGTAVQNMNIMLGMDEKQGLT